MIMLIVAIQKKIILQNKTKRQSKSLKQHQIMKHYAHFSDGYPWILLRRHSKAQHNMKEPNDTPLKNAEVEEGTFLPETRKKADH